MFIFIVLFVKYFQNNNVRVCGNAAWCGFF
jgi:hypothetical protein